MWAWVWAEMGLGVGRVRTSMLPWIRELVILVLLRDGLGPVEVLLFRVLVGLLFFLS